MRKLLAFLISGAATFPISCETVPSGENLTVYETVDKESAIYFQDNRFLVGRAFEEGDARSKFFEAVSEPAQVDSNGCLRFGPLTLPPSLRELECAEIRFELNRTENGWMLLSSAVDNSGTTVRMISKDGAKIEIIQFSPSLKKSGPYFLVQGDGLTLSGQ